MGRTRELLAELGHLSVKRVKRVYAVGVHQLCEYLKEQLNASEHRFLYDTITVVAPMSEFKKGDVDASNSNST